MTPTRLGSGGRVDRSVLLDVRVDDLSLQAFPGDTLASALLASGVRRVGSSVNRGRPRGIMTAGPEEPSALVRIEKPYPETVITATTVEVIDSLVAHTLHGQGRLSEQAAPAVHPADQADHRETYDSIHHHCDVAVVGAGPAGLAAAITAARAGVRVALIDERPEPGGSLLTAAQLEWAGRMSAALAALPGVLHLQRTAVTGIYDGNYLIALERKRTQLTAVQPGAVRERVWHLRAAEVVLATGAYERPIVFGGNDIPGVMLAESVRGYLHRYGVLAGEQVVLFTAHDDAYRVAGDLLATGASVIIVDPRTAAGQPTDLPEGPVATGTVIAGAVVTTAHADQAGELSAVTVQLADGRTRQIPADLLAVSGGWNPALQLYSHAGGRPSFDPAAGTFLPAAAVPGVGIAGAAGGLRTTAEIVDDGERAGAAAAEAAGTAAGLAGAHGHTDVTAGVLDLAPPADGLAQYAEPCAALYLVADPDADPLTLTEHLVDVQRDATVADLARATGAGLRSVEHVKRYTTAGTAHDQGKTSGLLATAVTAQLTGAAPADLGTTTSRPPVVPVAFAALAGREHGDLYDPIRTTGAHAWHISHGAVFELVGQWKRPRYYPLPAGDGGSGLVETMDQAVARECAAARTGVAFMDASTLGKIDVQGPDAGVFLDLLYTNLMSSLKVGSVRYGAMCGVDGMIMDDGTVTRLADDRFLATTTTGNAAKVLDWMEEWLQTEWPELRVRCTSVTEHYATMALVGPLSRDLLSQLAPELDCSAAAFGFMTAREASVAGLASRVSRISFSGELAYEITIPWWDAAALWSAVASAGGSFGSTPYGTEAMHVLRAEKGYPIIGQDTDGSQTPQDLGMSWAISKKKADYLGKRSHTRSDATRADRKHLVGLLPADPDLLLPEGAQLVAQSPLPPAPVPMLGHVTSSYRSVALGRTFALALVAGGRELIGQDVFAVVGDVPQRVSVVKPVLFDPEGARKDGDPDREPGGPDPSDGAGADPSPSPAPIVTAGPPVSPLADFAGRFAAVSAGPDAGVRIAEEPMLSLVDLRAPARSAAAQRVSDGLQCPLPTVTNEVGVGDHLTALALGPDEYLLVRGPGHADELEQAARTALAGQSGAFAVTDVSASRTVIRISGRNARRVLAHGCALDLPALSRDRCAQTVLAQCSVILDSAGDPGTDDDLVKIFVRSSFAAHLAQWLLVTAPEYV